MKRLSDNGTLMIPPVRLYLDDIDHILTLITKDMSAELHHKNYSYVSLDELKSHIRRDSINSLTVRAYCNNNMFGGLTIDIEQNGVRMYTDDQAAERRAHISEILRSKVKWYSWKPMEPWWYGIRGVLAFAIPILTYSSLGFATHLPIAAIIVLSILIWGASITVFFSDRAWLGGSKIYLYTRYGKPTFWQRNNEAIIAGIVSSIISALIGFLLGYFTK